MPATFVIIFVLSNYYVTAYRLMDQQAFFSESLYLFNNIIWLPANLLVDQLEVRPLRIGECPSNSPFLKNNGAEAHCF
jgi:hypothetical protein